MCTFKLDTILHLGLRFVPMMQSKSLKLSYGERRASWMMFDMEFRYVTYGIFTYISYIWPKFMVNVQVKIPHINFLWVMVSLLFFGGEPKHIEIFIVSQTSGYVWIFVELYCLLWEFSPSATFGWGT